MIHSQWKDESWSFKVNVNVGWRHTVNEGVKVKHSWPLLTKVKYSRQCKLKINSQQKEGKSKIYGH